MAPCLAPSPALFPVRLRLSAELLVHSPCLPSVLLCGARRERCRPCLAHPHTTDCIAIICFFPGPPSRAACPQAFGKKKLRWKRIAEHFDRHKKDCRKQYTKVWAREVPAGTHARARACACLRLRRCAMCVCSASDLHYPARHGRHTHQIHTPPPSLPPSLPSQITGREAPEDED